MANCTSNTTPLRSPTIQPFRFHKITEDGINRDPHRAALTLRNQARSEITHYTVIELGQLARAFAKHVTTVGAPPFHTITTSLNQRLMLHNGTSDIDEFNDAPAKEFVDIIDLYQDLACLLSFRTSGTITPLGEAVRILYLRTGALIDSAHKQNQLKNFTLRDLTYTLGAFWCIENCFPFHDHEAQLTEFGNTARRIFIVIGDILIQRLTIWSETCMGEQPTKQQILGILSIYKTMEITHPIIHHSIANVIIQLHSIDRTLAEFTTEELKEIASECSKFKSHYINERHQHTKYALDLKTLMKAIKGALALRHRQAAINSTRSPRRTSRKPPPVPLRTSRS